MELGGPIDDLLASAQGVRLNQSQYQQDFESSLWLAEGADAWKLECRQSYSEVGFPSWEAFMAGEWDSALRLYEGERAGIASFLQRLARRQSTFYRVRIILEPVTPYVQWEMYCLKLRAECGEQVRVISRPQASAPSLPELVSLSGQVLYHTIYSADQEPDGAIRYTDPELIRGYENFARTLYEAGEDVVSYFTRAIADLPPPSPPDKGRQEPQRYGSGP